MRKHILFIIINLIFSQHQSLGQIIRGEVTYSIDNAPMVGAIVYHQHKEVTTDSKGRYTIEIDSTQNRSLTFEAHGCERIVVDISGRSEINVAFEYKPVLLNEIIITAFLNPATFVTTTRSSCFHNYYHSETKRIEGKIIIEKTIKNPDSNFTWQDRLIDSITYPKIAIESAYEGRIYAQFTIDTKGNIKDVSIVRGLFYPMDEEILRLLNAMPKWAPDEIERMGKIRDVIYDRKYLLPVRFKMEYVPHNTR